MLRIANYGANLAKTARLERGTDVTLDMERSTGLKNLSYAMTFTLSHDNAQALGNDVNVFLFFKNFLANIKFQTGAGSNIFDLNTTDMLILHLMEQKKLRFDIDKTQGNGKVSSIYLKWDFILPIGFYNRLDSVFHSDNKSYNYVQLKFKPQNIFNQVADLTINNIELSVVEDFKREPTPSVVAKGDKVYVVPPLNKTVFTKDYGFNSSSKSEVIEIPRNKNILGFYAYVLDAKGDLKSDGINSVSIKNGNEYFYSETFKNINDENRDTLKSFSDESMKDFIFIDIAKGQMTEGLNRDNAGHSNTALSFDLTATEGSNVLKIMYLTVEDA